MKVDMYAVATPERAARRKELTPEINEPFLHFSRPVFAEGTSPEKTMQLIAVAVAHVAQCPYFTTGHQVAHHKGAHHKGARREEIIEAIRVAAEMRAGRAYAHSTVALHAMVKKTAERT